LKEQKVSAQDNINSNQVHVGQGPAQRPRKPEWRSAEIQPL